MHGIRNWFWQHPAIFAILGLFVTCVVFFHQPLFSGGIVNATDILTQQYFWNSFIKENLFADPCFQTWLPYVNAGTPFSGGLDLLFRPGMLLTLLLLPVHLALNYEMIFYFFVMGVGMYFYMRELGVKPLTAFFAALFLMLNGEIVTLLNAGHVNKIGAIAPVTFVFWGLERALQRHTLRAYIWAGVALGVQFWQGHIQISFYTCIAVGIYWVVRMVVSAMQTKSVRPVGRAVVYAVVMVVVFLMLSAVNFLPLIAFAQVSDRAEGVSYEFATSWSMPPEELIMYVIPNFFGLRRANHFEDEADIQQVEYWGRMPFTQTGRYFGLLPLFFTLFAVCLVHNRHVLTLGIVALVILLLGMGQYIPTYKILYTYIPGFNMFRAPQMILFLFAFVTSALAGFGAEWFWFDFSEKKNRQLRLFLLIGITFALCAWVFTFLLPQWEPALLVRFSDTLLRNGAPPELARLRLQNIVRGWLQFDLLFSIILFVIGLRLASSIRMRWAVLAVLLVYLPDVWLFNEKYIDTIPIQNSFYVDENDAIRYFKAHPGYYRALQLTNTPDTYNVFNKYVIHHLCSVSGYEAVGVQYYNEYLENMTLGSPMLDLLNIKYLIFPKGVQFNDGQPAQVGQTIGPYKVVLDADAVVVENLNVLPRVYPVHQAYVIQNPQERLGALNDPQFNPQEAVILEEVPPVAMAPTDLPSSQSQAEISYYLNRTIRVKVSMATEGFLVLSEKYYRGWKAYVDGRETPIYRANHALQAIIVPEGDHQVTFAFQPTQFLIGFAITLLMAIGLLVWWVFRNDIKAAEESMMSMLYVKFELIGPKLRRWYHSSRLLWGLVCFGILLHGVQYGFNRSLWVDEAGVALNILDKSYPQLLPKLSSQAEIDYTETAPTGFLLIEKFFVQLYGDSEYALRFWPFVCGIFSIVLFYKLMPCFVSPSAKPIALLLFITSSQLIYYASSLKQYSGDVFFSLFLYVLAVMVYLHPPTWGMMFVFGVVGALAIWCSHPAVFVLAGVGGWIGIVWLKNKAVGSLAKLLLAYGCWGVSFMLRYALLLRQVVGHEVLEQFWGDRFMPFPPTSLMDLLWFPHMFFDTIGYVMGLPMFQSFFQMFFLIGQIVASLLGLSVSSGLSLPEIARILLSNILWIGVYLSATTLLIIGGGMMVRKRTDRLLLLAAPILLNLIASGLHRYPFGNRMILFIMFPFFLVFAEGAAGIISNPRKKVTSFGIVAICLVCLFPLYHAVVGLVSPRKHEEARPVMEYLKDHRRPGDVIYVYYASQQVFTYYARRFDLTSEHIIQGIASRDNWMKYVDDLNQLRGQSRVWLFFSHAYSEEAFFLSYLDTIGKQQDAFQDVRAAVYLYDLSVQ